MIRKPQLSTNKGDQKFLKIAKGKLLLKQKMIDILTESTNREAKKVFDKKSQSNWSVGKSIGDGMALLAVYLSDQQPTNIANIPESSISNKLSERTMSS